MFLSPTSKWSPRIHHKHGSSSVKKIVKSKIFQSVCFVFHRVVYSRVTTHSSIWEEDDWCLGKHKSKPLLELKIWLQLGFHGCCFQVSWEIFGNGAVTWPITSLKSSWGDVCRRAVVNLHCQLSVVGSQGLLINQLRLFASTRIASINTACLALKVSPAPCRTALFFATHFQNKQITADVLCSPVKIFKSRVAKCSSLFKSLWLSGNYDKRATQRLGFQNKGMSLTDGCSRSLHPGI